MSTIIAIQDLDTSTDPPSNGTIHAVVSLLWPYSSSTRQCALLLSERDSRLRARGGQIRVKFSGPTARAVAEGKLGIGNEVVLELGSGQWVRDEVGVAVHVPGKSVGELQFGRGVRLRVQKEGAEDVEVNVAEDAVDENEQEQEQEREEVSARVVRTPAKRTSPAATFRSSIGSTPGSNAIYSSPAYMRRAAKFSYLDGLSRLFEDEWENQDLPRKKARTSIGEVKSWKVVDRTPSPERRSSASVIQVDEEMAEAEDVAGDHTMDNQSSVEPSDGQALAAEVTPVVSSSVSVRALEEPRVKSPLKKSESQLSPLEQLATSALEDQRPNQPQAPSNAPAYPELHLPSASPTPQPHEAEPVVGLPTDDPVTPRLLPLSSTALPSTTPQISPLATMLAFETQSEAERAEGIENASETVELPDVHAEVDVDTLATPKAATEDLLEQIQFAPSDTGSAVETRPDPANAETMNSEASRDADALLQPKLDDLAEEDGFSDEEAEKNAFPDQEADETLSAHEHDDEIMQEDDDDDDVFDTAALGGERMSDEDTTEDREMHEMRGHGRQWLDESTTEKDSDLEEQQSTQDMLHDQAATQPMPRKNIQEASQQPGFTPASTLLHATETPIKAPSVATEKVATTTPLAKPQLQADRTVTSIEATTPAAKPTDTPKTTPQSARDRVMKRTFSSLFGIKGTPSPEKEDLIRSSDGANDVDGVGSQVKQDDGVQHTLESDRLQRSSEGLQQNAQTQEDTAAVSHEAFPAMAQDSHAQQEAAIFASDMQPSLPKAAEHPPGPLDKTSAPGSSQVEDMLPEQQPAELINLDSDSEGEDQVEAVAPNQTPSKPQKPALVPQKRPSARPADVPEAMRDDVEPASADAILGSAEEAEASISEPIFVDETEIAGQHEPSDDHRGSPSRNFPANDAVVSQNEKNDGASPSEPPAVSESIMQPDVSMADTNEQLLTSTFPQSPAHVEPPHPSLVESGVSDSAQSESLGIFEGLEDIPGQVYDAEMQVDHPGTLLEETGPASVLVSQEAMDAERVAAAGRADLERPRIHQGLDGADHSEEDFEMQDDDLALREPSQASFQSQVVEDDVKMQDHIARESSSRPISRDTIEDFSPVVLGSMSQRITDIVSNESAAKRLRELESQEDAAADENDQEVPEVSTMADMIDEAAAQPTPTRAEKHTEVIDILSSPSESSDFSPVRLTRGTQELVATSQPQDNVDIQEKAVTREQADALEEEEAAKREEVLGLQLQAPDNTAEQRPAATRESLDENYTQTSLADDPANVEEVADITPSLSPFAIDAQTLGQDAGVSHANAAQAAMQPTPMDTQLRSDLHPSIDHDASKAFKNSQMAPADHHEEEQIEMPPPEQTVPPKTPARKSFRSRLSNVPDVISAWFSPKRSSIAARQSEKILQVDEPSASTADAVQPSRTPKKHVSGISTAHGYFTSLASLDQHLNPSSQQAGAVDVLAVVTDFTKDPERAKGGPRDYYTVFKITDESLSDSSGVRVEVFRPWKAVLPAADVGDVVLLRAFVVKSKKRQPFLMSTDASGWCVWRFAEHSKTVHGPDRADGEKPVWARRMSHGDVREEVKGPPVEYGLAEKEQARRLREWWNEKHSEPQREVSEELVGKDQEEDSHAVKL